MNNNSYANCINRGIEHPGDCQSAVLTCCMKTCGFDMESNMRKDCLKNCNDIADKHCPERYYAVENYTSKKSGSVNIVVYVISAIIFLLFMSTGIYYLVRQSVHT